ncbi:MAG: hypothetical protein ABI683_06955, partial [Ginsengibacter sp.]
MITVDLNSIFPSLSADLLDEMHEHGSVRHLWVFLLTITGIAIAGIVIGGLISKRVRGDKLKK